MSQACRTITTKVGAWKQNNYTNWSSSGIHLHSKHNWWGEIACQYMEVISATKGDFQRMCALHEIYGPVGNNHVMFWSIKSQKCQVLWEGWGQSGKERLRKWHFWVEEYLDNRKKNIPGRRTMGKSLEHLEELKGRPHGWGWGLEEAEDENRRWTRGSLQIGKGFW